MSFNRDYLKNRYYIEPNGFSSWIFRREGSNNIIKKDKHRRLLITFAEMYSMNENSELRICDSNGMLEEILEIGTNKMISI